MAERGEDDPSDPAYWMRGMGEGRTPFQPDPMHRPGLETLRSIYAAVMDAYDYRCAATGLQFNKPAELLVDGLEITPIRPLSDGGALHVQNFICFALEAGTAFRAGHLSIGPHYQFLADLSRIAPELLLRLNADGRLNLPVGEVARPDEAALAFHREHIFTGA